MKILIISQHLFPIQTPRAHRTTELAKELAKQGHDVILYAVLGKHDYSEFEVENNLKVKSIPIYLQFHPYSSDGDSHRNFLDKVLGRLFQKILEFPNIEFMFKAKRILKKEKDIDLLISIADPHQIHWGCAKAKVKNPETFPKVWIADCGDPFMSNGKSSKHLRYFAKLEKLFCKHCDYITVPVKEAVEAYYPEFRHKIKIIPQGFDFDINWIPETEPINDCPSFAYAGLFYKDIRNPEPFFKFLSSLDRNFRFHVYTKFTELVVPFQKVLGEKLIVHSPISRLDLLEELKKMDFLLNLENTDRPNQIPSKLIDYAIVKRPILSIVPTSIDTNKVISFFQKDYSNQLVILNIERYHISTVASSFTKLHSNRDFRFSPDINAKKQLCSRCVMDNSDTDITINNDGNCNHCTNFFERISHRVYQGEKSETDLLQIIENIKLAGKKSKYDCVIGVSGGVDSSYLAYKAKKRGLRALLVHLDNGWNSEVSVKNIKNLADILGFDYESFVLDWEEFKDLQLSFLRASVPEMETPTDIAILGALHKVAAKYGVKYILSGGNFATEGILPKTWHYDAKDAKYLYSIHKKFGRKKLKSFPMFGFKQEAYYKFIKGIKIVYMLNYIPYNKEESMKILQNELGWRYYGGKHYESKYTGFVQSYIMPVKFNMDYRRATFSTQICTGEVTREWALAELEKPPYNPDTIQAEKEYICKKLGISLLEFERIMDDPPKLYRDYPNNEKMLQSLYRLYRKLTKTQSYKGD